MTSQNNALVTGVSSGIGRAIALRLLEQQYRVIGLARDTGKCNIKSNKFTPVNIDLADLESLAQRLPALAKEHSNVNTLICCAGRGQFGSLEEFSYEQINALINLNFTSQAYITRAFLPRMKQAGRGDIIFIGSEAALNGERKGAIYCASKFALRGMAQALREECSRTGIRVTIINPGMVKTPFFKSLNFEPGPEPSHYLEANDVANAVSMVLTARPETVFDEINLSPLKHVIQHKPS